MSEQFNTRYSWIQIDVKCTEKLTDIISEYLISSLGRGVVIEESDEPFNDGIKEIQKIKITAYLENRDSANSSQELYRIINHLKNLEKTGDNQDISIECSPIEGNNWKESWKEYFKPFKVGKHIVIKPSWEHFNPEDKDIVVEIDPGQAFGVGTHASTSLMLESIEKIFKETESVPKSIIDIGTGTGILAITAAKIGAKSVKATDIDPEAINTAKTNAKLNNVDHLIDITSETLSAIKGKFDLILANIDRDTLIALSDDIASITDKNSILLVSGILDTQAEEVVNCYEEKGFQEISISKHRDEFEWVCLLFHKI